MSIDQTQILVVLEEDTEKVVKLLSWVKSGVAVGNVFIAPNLAALHDALTLLARKFNGTPKHFVYMINQPGYGHLPKCVLEALKRHNLPFHQSEPVDI